jgi:hypothetical protein
MGSILQWIEDQKTGLDLVVVIRSYLLARVTKSAISFLHPNSSLRMAARLHNHLGWHNFVEGRICALWVEMRAQEIHTRGLQKGADFWERVLMQHLLQLTHRQWLYCNATVHMKVKDGLTIAQHNTILMHIKKCLQIDPAYLLVEGWELLEANFDKLTHGPTSDS